MIVFGAKDRDIAKLVDANDRKLPASESQVLQVELCVWARIFVYSCRQLIIIQPRLYLVFVKTDWIERIGLHADDNKAAIPPVRHT